MADKFKFKKPGEGAKSLPSTEAPAAAPTRTAKNQTSTKSETRDKKVIVYVTPAEKALLTQLRGTQSESMFLYPTIQQLIKSLSH